VKFKKVIPLSYEKKLGEEKESQKTYSLYDNLEIKSNNGSLSQGEPAPERKQKIYETYYRRFISDDHSRIQC
jgi:hypothetical protein